MTFNGEWVRSAQIERITFQVNWSITRRECFYDEKAETNLKCCQMCNNILLFFSGYNQQFDCILGIFYCVSHIFAWNSIYGIRQNNWLPFVANVSFRHSFNLRKIFILSFSNHNIYSFSICAWKLNVDFIMIYW